jgi:tRNA(Arg) A34 adenosine deaminase TadA
MMHEDFMRRALQIAGQSLDEPGAMPYGAVVVRDGTIIGEGLNRALAKSDPTSHGEVEAIRAACKHLGTTDLSGADLYTTAEPCSMCVATMYLAGIERVYYASGAKESGAFMARLAARDPKWTRRISGPDLRREVGLPMEGRQMQAVPLLSAEAHALFDAFAKKQGA